MSDFARNVFSALIVVILLSSTLEGQGTPPGTANWSSVEQALGRKGAAQPGNVMKFSFPRSDLAVTVRGVTLRPALALGGWVAFKEVRKGESMAMGDLVLTDDEIAPVMKTLQAGGVEQTALHNHLLNETPHIMYMHILAHGDAAKIARTLHEALASSRTPMGQPAAAPTASATDLDTAGIAKALGTTGKLNGVVYQVGVPRAEKITEMHEEVPPSMGVATSLNFQPTGGGKAAITGDFVLRGPEVTAVMRALRDHGIEVTALHSHMIDESPKLYFMHFWANDDAQKLAKALRGALDLTNSRHGG
jgi:hypothetical protein